MSKIFTNDAPPILEEEDEADEASAEAPRAPAECEAPALQEALAHEATILAAAGPRPDRQIKCGASTVSARVSEVQETRSVRVSEVQEEPSSYAPLRLRSAATTANVCVSEALAEPSSHTAQEALSTTVPSEASTAAAGINPSCASGSSQATASVVVSEAQEELPVGWRTASSPDGRVYFYHAATQTTQWTRPTNEAVEPPLADGWRKVRSLDGEAYYYHVATQKTQWTRPSHDAMNEASSSSAELARLDA